MMKALRKAGIPDELNELRNLRYCHQEANLDYVSALLSRLIPLQPACMGYELIP
jgi:hypothetical protein